MNENIENVLATLDGFRTNDEMTYSAYSTLHDEISLLDDLLKEQEPVKPVKTWDTYLCGNCNRNVYHEERQGCLVLYEERYTYCPNCGKRLDWNAGQGESDQ